MKTKLLACPFCKGKVGVFSEENESGLDKFYVSCLNCSATLGYIPNTGAEYYAPDHVFASKEDAAAAWNAGRT
jgi:uncharacterized protein YbaR (Trm112 family)